MDYHHPFKVFHYMQSTSYKTIGYQNHVPETTIDDVTTLNLLSCQVSPNTSNIEIFSHSHPQSMFFKYVLWEPTIF
jgi:hypothetical protein